MCTYTETPLLDTGYDTQLLSQHLQCDTWKTQMTDFRECPLHNFTNFLNILLYLFLNTQYTNWCIICVHGIKQHYCTAYTGIHVQLNLFPLTWTFNKKNCNSKAVVLHSKNVHNFTSANILTLNEHNVTFSFCHK